MFRPWLNLELLCLPSNAPVLPVKGHTLIHTPSIGQAAVLVQDVVKPEGQGNVLERGLADFLLVTDCAQLHLQK